MLQMPFLECGNQVLCNVCIFRFCTVGGDKKLRYFSTQGKQENTTVRTFTGHTGYINGCTVEPLAGELVASVSGK